MEQGLHAANMPEEAGGGGLDFLSATLMDRELGKSTWGLVGWVGRPSEILNACQADQRDTYLLPTVRGERKEAFGLTEPNAGSDAMSIQTRATADGGDYVIHGSKHFISCVTKPDFVILFTVTGIDNSQRQLETARRLGAEHRLDISWIHGNAEQVPRPDGSYDFAVSEYGAAIWCDPGAANPLYRDGTEAVTELLEVFVNGLEMGIHRPAFAFGIQKKVFRHAFTIGFSNSPGTTTSQRAGTRATFLGDPSADTPSGMFISFDLSRQLF